jgi:hypothetical protein
MRSWGVQVTWLGDADEYWTEVDADTIEDAARKVWEEWGPTGWTSAFIDGGGIGNWGRVDLDKELPNFTRGWVGKR